MNYICFSISGMISFTVEGGHAPTIGETVFYQGIYYQILSKVINQADTYIVSEWAFQAITA